ncbi:hypothetical protein niasHT_019251 [Heterodera trifolii]|uniref:Uncharacterized protein n=1 Tax=Heterodera trifolii TaxID=157864 RepID=A0ABD2L0S7_9BILA
MIQLPLQYGCHRLPSEAVEKVRGLCPARGNPLNVTFLVKIKKKFDFEVVTALLVTRLVELYNRKGPLPKTKGQIRIFVLEVQTILLGILEPDGRKLFPSENQRTIIDHKGTQAWAEYFPSGILATPGHHFRFNMAAIASHPKPWRKFVACALHEGIHSM